MTSVVFGGIKYIQTRHAVYCKLCKDTIQSNFIHDFKLCSCKSAGIDGGILPGNRILGKLEDIESRSVYCATVKGKLVFLPYYVLETAYLNNIEKYNQDAREVKGRASYGDSDLVKEVTEGGSSS
jgi:hypothetical protein